MAHYQQLKFVEEVGSIFPEYFKSAKVLEVGSWSKYGSIRNFFTNVEYVGADVLPGPGVDVVCGGQDLSFADNEFDLSISCECFEHNPFWVETFLNMIRMLRPGGLCIVTCATIGRKEHGTKRSSPEASLTTELPDEDDYYGNLTKKDFETKAQLSEHFVDYRFYKNVYSKDLYFVGVKAGGESPDGLNERFTELGARAANITTEKGANISRKILGNLASVLQETVIPIIGDHKYRSVQHQIRKLKNSL